MERSRRTDWCKKIWHIAYRGKRHAERQFSESVTWNKCYKGKAEIELYQGRKYNQSLINKRIMTKKNFKFQAEVVDR